MNSERTVKRTNFGYLLFSQTEEDAVKKRIAEFLQETEVKGDGQEKTVNDNASKKKRRKLRRTDGRLIVKIQNQINLQMK